MTQEADTDPPRGTKELEGWTFAHGSGPSLNNDHIQIVNIQTSTPKEAPSDALKGE